MKKQSSCQKTSCISCYQVQHASFVPQFTQRFDGTSSAQLALTVGDSNTYSCFLESVCYAHTQGEKWCFRNYHNPILGFLQTASAAHWYSSLSAFSKASSCEYDNAGTLAHVLRLYLTALVLNMHLPAHLRANKCTLRVN